MFFFFYCSIGATFFKRNASPGISVARWHSRGKYINTTKKDIVKLEVSQKQNSIIQKCVVHVKLFVGIDLKKKKKFARLNGFFFLSTANIYNIYFQMTSHFLLRPFRFFFNIFFFSFSFSSSSFSFSFSFFFLFFFFFSSSSSSSSFFLDSSSSSFLPLCL